MISGIIRYILFRLSAISYQPSGKRWLYTCFVPLFLSSGCWIYSLGGASVPPGMKTISIQYFDNNAPLVVSNLGQKFRDALQERIRNQSKLSIVRTNADGNFEGNITDYNIAPVAVQGNDRAGLLRLTITVNVKYTNAIRPADGFEQSFSRYVDFPPPLSSVEQQKISEINKMLVEDIFNRAFANW